MTPAVLFIALAALIVVAAGVALAGRWQPEGLPQQAPQDPDRTVFDVVVRGYRMEQVDAEIERLNGLLAQAGDEEDGS